MDWGEVNPTHAYYNGSRTSKDNEDPGWNTSFKTRRTQKTTSAVEALGETIFSLFFVLLGTFYGRGLSTTNPITAMAEVIGLVRKGENRRVFESSGEAYLTKLLDFMMEKKLILGFLLIDFFGSGGVAGIPAGVAPVVSEVVVFGLAVDCGKKAKA
ncbi:hypothetical protein Tco_0256157 [Tanacetum coccineum]